MVIVYPTIKEREEFLRYSLRSIERNLIGDYDVILIGHYPCWVKNVGYVPFSDNGNRYANTINKAIISAYLYKDFIWFNDDIFVLKPITIDYLKEPTYLEDFAKIKRFGKKWYQRKLRAQYETFKRLGIGTLNYATHTPKYYESQKVLDTVLYFGLNDSPEPFFENFYFNLHNMKEPRLMVDKVGKYDTSPFNKKEADGKIFLNFDELGAATGAFDFVKEMFPNKSHYEK